jgi:predicted HicB family RNase H-like nuclease
MSKSKYSECMTLRLEPHIEEMVTEASYDARLSKNEWIRRAIRCSLKQKLRGEERLGRAGLAIGRCDPQ